MAAGVMVQVLVGRSQTLVPQADSSSALHWTQVPVSQTLPAALPAQWASVEQGAQVLSAPHWEAAASGQWVCSVQASQEPAVASQWSRPAPLEGVWPVHWAEAVQPAQAPESQTGAPEPQWSASRQATQVLAEVSQ